MEPWNHEMSKSREKRLRYVLSLYTQLIVGWIIPVPLNRLLLIIINHNNHPDTNLPVIRQQGRTMNPAIASLVTTKLRHPLDTRRDAAARHHSVENVIPLGT